MQEFERASLHKEFVNEENNTGSYVFEPLERGFGITIGNTICRTLLTSVPGTSIVGFKVSGFDGKATMVDGILEDIYRISLNLKAVQLYNDGEGFQTLHISKKGPATIQAADIICPEAVEVVDPEQVICTLEKGANLEMEIYAVTGTGYKSSIENKVSYDFGEDVVVLDATFTPIRKADYLAEPARVGLDKKYDKVHINVETDGTITPLQAITMAAKILGAAVVGSMIATMISFSTTITLNLGNHQSVALQSDVFDNIMPCLLPAVLASVCFGLVRKGKKTTTVMLVLFVIAFILAFLEGMPMFQPAAEETAFISSMMM